MTVIRRGIPRAFCCCCCFCRLSRRQFWSPIKAFIRIVQAKKLKQQRQKSCNIALCEMRIRLSSPNASTGTRATCKYITRIKCKCKFMNSSLTNGTNWSHLTCTSAKGNLQRDSEFRMIQNPSTSAPQ